MRAVALESLGAAARDAAALGEAGEAAALGEATLEATAAADDDVLGAGFTLDAAVAAFEEDVEAAGGLEGLEGDDAAFGGISRFRRCGKKMRWSAQ
jgi:hypothetical protein